VAVNALTIEMALREIERRIEARDPGYVTITGVHGVSESLRSPELMAIHNEAALVCPDGMPMVWSSRYAGFRWAERVYGPDLMLAMCAASVRTGSRHFFYGGGDGVATLLQHQLEQRFVGLEVVGTHTPPFRPLDDREKAEVAALINEARPDVVWVGLSTPKQERWMAEMRPRLDAPVLIGVGAAFDFHAGLVSQAPAQVQRLGLEWLYRLFREPRRLWRRYLRNNPAFVAAILRDPPRAIGSDPG
jgi:N-acetylglucosaminyldiphosphoundecaprenol N-acetyl-beta-D-mannosaminyltransferase